MRGWNKLEDRLTSDECLRCHFKWANVENRTCVAWMHDLRGTARRPPGGQADGRPGRTRVRPAVLCRGLRPGPRPVPRGIHRLRPLRERCVRRLGGAAAGYLRLDYGAVLHLVPLRHPGHAGIIDEGWRGELRAMLYRPIQTLQPQSCPMPDVLHLPAGTRVAQLIMMTNVLPTVRMIQVPDGIELPDGSRGTNGFGSSGD